MSASSSPTFSPCAERARARLQAVVDLPTPPLPEATATMWRTPGKRGAGAGRGGPARLRRLRCRGLGRRGGLVRPALRSEAGEDAGDARHGQDGALGLAPDRLETLSLAGVDQDREHDPVGGVDHDLGQAARCGQRGPAGIDGDGGQRLEHVVASDGQDVSPGKTKGRAARTLPCM